MDTSLPPGYQLRLVERFKEPQFTDLVDRLLIRPSAHIPPDQLRGEVDPARLKAIQKRRDMRRIGIFAGDTLAALTVGWQDDDERYYMALSLVLPEHRRRGLYSALVRESVARARAGGYSEVWSRHVATNNPVIIAKLKLGFTVSGVELMPAHGVMVRLTCPLSPGMQAAMDVRSGWRKAPATWARRLVSTEGEPEDPQGGAPVL